jgi:hypothetical protein
LSAAVPDTVFLFAYAYGSAGEVLGVAVRAERLCDRETFLHSVASRIGERGGVARFSYVLDVREDRAEVSCAALDDVPGEVGEAFFVAMIGRSRALSRERWEKFRASLARGGAPFVVGGGEFVARLAKWAQAIGGGREMWARLANLFWWYRNRRRDADLLPLLVRIRDEKVRLRGGGVSWSDIARVSVCLKRRRGADTTCSCSMCRGVGGGR